MKSKNIIIIIISVILSVSLLVFCLYLPFLTSKEVREYFIETKQITEISQVHYNSQENSFELYESPEVDGFSTVYLNELPNYLQILVNVFEFIYVKGVILL